MAAKRIFFVTKLGMYLSTQFMHEAVDLHELCVDILMVLPAIPGREYTDAEAVRAMTNKDTWEESYFLISEFDPVKRMFRELVKDHDGWNREFKDFLYFVTF